jgi:Rv0623-like transcription factor
MWLATYIIMCYPLHMPRRSTAQLNIRSDFAKARATELARETGMSVTQVVEDAVRAYVPQPSSFENHSPGLTRDGALLILPSLGRKVSMAELNAAIEQSRNSDLCND